MEWALQSTDSMGETPQPPSLRREGSDVQRVNTLGAGVRTIGSRYVFTQHGNATLACAVSNDGSRALTTGNDGTVRLWDLNRGTPACGRLPQAASSVFGCAVATPPANVAAATADGLFGGSVFVWTLPEPNKNTQPKRVHILKCPRTRYAWDCALSADGTVLLASFASTNANGKIIRCESSTPEKWSNTAEWRLPDNAQPLSLSMNKDATVVAITASIDGYRSFGAVSSPKSSHIICVLDARSGDVLNRLSVVGRPSIAMSADGLHVVIADFVRLRMYSSKERPASDLEHQARSPRRACAIVVNHDAPDFGVRPVQMERYSRGPSSCAVSADGTVVLGNLNPTFDIGIWHGLSGKLIGRLKGHLTFVQNMDVSASRSVAVSTSADCTVRCWDLAQLNPVIAQAEAQFLSKQDDDQFASLSPVSSSYDVTEFEFSPVDPPPPFPSLSVLDQALQDALMFPDQIQTALGAISKENVTNVSDLVCGHNIVLIAIREGVITKDNIHGLGDQPFFLEEELYGAIKGKMPSQADKHIAKYVLWHAQLVGIIPSGYSVLLADEVLEITRNDVEQIQSIVLGLSERVCVLEKRADEVELIMKELGETSAVIGNSVCELAKSLTDLRRVLHTNFRNQQIAALAKVALACIPFAGHLASEVVNAGVAFLSSFVSPDVISVGSNILNQAGGFFSVADLSNFYRAQISFSETIMQRMEPQSRRALEMAVNKSEFKSLDGLRQELDERARNDTSVEARVSEMLDRWNKDWLNGVSVESASPHPSRESESRVFSEDLARDVFRIAAQGEESLTYRTAINEIKAQLVRLDRISAVSQEDIFEAVSASDVDANNRIGLNEFIAIFEILAPKVNPPSEGLTGIWEQKFTKAAGSPLETLPCFQAARIITQIANSGQGSRTGRTPAIGSPVEVRQVQDCFARNGKSLGSDVNLELFLEVAKTVMYG